MPARSQIGEILMNAGVLGEAQLRLALHRQGQSGGRIARVVAEMGLASEETIAQTIASALKLPRVRLEQLAKDSSALSKLDATFCEQNAVFPVETKDRGKTLVLAMADPSDAELLEKAASKAAARIKPAVAGEKEIHQAILRLYRADEPPVGPGVATSLGERSAAQLLDDIMSNGDQLTRAELQRLESLRANQAKSGKILRALMELLMEKGYTTRKELANKVKL
jgi:hypothetical protein